MSKVKMVDISRKDIVYREAIAEGIIKLRKETVQLIKEGKIEKGDVFTTSTIAAIMAVKKTPELIPLTHNIPIYSISVTHELIDEDKIRVKVTVRTQAKTGAEIEAIMGVNSALTTIWDMVKKYEKDQEGQYPVTMIEGVRVVRKIKMLEGQ